MVAAFLLAGMWLNQAPRAVHADEPAGATLTWSFNRYAHTGVFGAWVQTATGDNVSLIDLNGQDVSGLPADAAKTFKTAVFTGGAGELDPATGEGTITWDTGDWNLNAYPPAFNAPNETFSDPILTIAANGSGTLSFNVTIAGGVDLNGDPSPTVGPERITIVTFSSLSELTTAQIKFTPDFQGRHWTPDGASVPATVECSGGIWGSWPAEYLNYIPSSIQPHYYTTSCGGLQDMKPALPVTITDITWEAPPAPAVTVTPSTEANPAGQTFSVSGANFATSAPGIYVAFGPSPDVLGESWFTNAASFQYAAWVHTGVVTPTATQKTLNPDGSFSFDIADITAVYTGDQEWDCTAVQCGILTMKAHGSGDRTQDTFTPVSFAAPPVVWNPQIQVSKTTNLALGGETVTVTGSGFDPSLNIGTRPPLSGQPAGFYVVFGRFADNWKPSDGIGSGARKVISQKWAIPPAAWATLNPGGTNAAYTQLHPDGTFSVEIEVLPDDSVTGNYGIYTYPGSGAVNANHEIYVPMSFAEPDTPPASRSISIARPPRPARPSPPR